MTVTPRIFMKQLKHSFSPVAHSSGKMLHILCHAVIASEETNLWKYKRKNIYYDWYVAYPARMRLSVSLRVKVCAVCVCVCSGKVVRNVNNTVPHQKHTKKNYSKVKNGVIEIAQNVWFIIFLNRDFVLLFAVISFINHHHMFFHERIRPIWVVESSLVIRCSPINLILIMPARHKVIPI